MRRFRRRRRPSGLATGYDGFQLHAVNICRRRLDEKDREQLWPLYLYHGDAIRQGDAVLVFRNSDNTWEVEERK